MTGILKQAIEQLATLPPKTQEKIGQELLLHVENNRRLKAKIEAGIESLQNGDSRELHIKEVIKRARALYGEG